MITEKHIPMGENSPFFGPATYTDATSGGYGGKTFLYTAANWAGASFYLEGFGKNDGANNMLIKLVDTLGNDVTSSELTFSAQGRQRSSALTLIDGRQYVVYIKSSTGLGNPACYDFRIVVVQNSNAYIGETALDIIGQYQTTSATTYQTVGFEQLYDATLFDGTINIYFEALLEDIDSAQTASVQLYDVTAAAAVTGSVLTNSTTTISRQRSGALTLTSGHYYAVQIKTSGGTSGAFVSEARILIVQSGTVKKTMCPLYLISPTFATAVDPSFSSQATSDILFDPANFSGVTGVTFKHYAIAENVSF